MNISDNRPLVRWDPKMEPQYYRTFTGIAPLTTHYRRATCKEVGCAAYENGWSFDKKVLTPVDYYRVTHSGKRYREVTVAPGATYLLFEAGQYCFDTHQIRLQREEMFFIGRGDWRMFDLRKAKQIRRAEDFGEQMLTHYQKVQDEIKRG